MAAASTCLPSKSIERTGVFLEECRVKEILGAGETQLLLIIDSKRCKDGEFRVRLAKVMDCLLYGGEEPSIIH